MTQTVNVPGVGKLNFPDGMSQADMAAAIQKNFPQVGTPKPAQDPAQFGGAGGYNPIRPLVDASGDIANSLGITDDNSSSPIANAAGPLEFLLQAGTGTVANAFGLASKYAPFLSNPAAAVVNEQVTGAGEQRKKAIEEALTYQPRTATGQILGRVVGAIPSAIIGKAEQYGGPYARDALETAVLVEGARGGIGKGVEPSAPYKRANLNSRMFDVPTTADLRKATNEAYKTAQDAGAEVNSAEFSKAADEIINSAKEDAVDPVLHPKSSRILQIIEDRKGRDLSLKEVENIRRIALEAEGDVNNAGQQSADGMRAGKIVDDLDEKIDALSLNDEARALNRRKMNSQLLDVMIERAQNKAGANYTQAGMEHALRREFLSLANNTRRMKRLDPEQKAAIQKVARGGPIQNILRTLGKFDPTSGVIPALATVATGGALGGAGFLARRAATNATVKNVETARGALIGRGLPQPSLQASLQKQLQRPPPLSEAERLSGNLQLGDYQPPPEVFRGLSPAYEPIPSKPMADLLSGNLSLSETPATPAMAPMGLRDFPSRVPVAKPRHAKQIQSEIQGLNEYIRTQMVEEGPDSPRLKLALSELQSLQRELEASRAHQ